MKIAHYYPNEFMNLWTEYSTAKFQPQCDDSTDIIYAGSVSRLEPALRAKEKFGKPLACWVWDIPYNWRSWARNEQELLANKKRDKVVAKYIAGLKQCDLVISASKYTQKVLNEQFGIDSHQRYFYLNYDEMDAIPDTKAKNYRVIQISRYVLNKRFELTIEATAGLPVETVFIGTGKEYHDHLAKLGKEKRPHYSYFRLYIDLPRSETLSMLKSSTILVSPSVFEGWGITPLEALYCGVPVVLSDLEVFREVHEDRVLYHEIDNADDMRRQIKRLLNDTKLREDMIEKSRKVVSSFTPQRFADSFDLLMEKNLL